MTGREYRFRHDSDEYTRVYLLHPNGRGDMDLIGTVETLDGGWFGRHFATGTTFSGSTRAEVCEAVTIEDSEQ